MAYQAGINHIEYWVSDAARSEKFYDAMFQLIGWRRMGRLAYTTGSIEIYFIEKKGLDKSDTIGPRHICFQATSRTMVDEVGEWLRLNNYAIIRGPVDNDAYSKGYYTVDFRDPDGYVIEVAFTPNMVM